MVQLIGASPFFRIEWHVDLMDSQHLCVTEIEELALGSDIIWSMRRQGRWPEAGQKRSETVAQIYVYIYIYIMKLLVFIVHLRQYMYWFSMFSQKTVIKYMCFSFFTIKYSCEDVR